MDNLKPIYKIVTLSFLIGLIVITYVFVAELIVGSEYDTTVVTNKDNKTIQEAETIEEGQVVEETSDSLKTLNIRIETTVSEKEQLRDSVNYFIKEIKDITNQKIELEKQYAETNKNQLQEIKDITNQKIELEKQYAEKIKSQRKEIETELDYMTYITAACASIILLLLSLIISYLLQWKKIISSTGNEFVKPPEFDKIMKKLISNYKNLEKSTNTAYMEYVDSSKSIKTDFFNVKDNIFHQFNNLNESNKKSIKELYSILQNLSDSITDKEQEIKRLKQGYDIHLLKKYHQNIIYCYQRIITLKKRSKNNDLNTIIRRMDEMFDDFGIKPFTIKVGDSFDKNKDKIEIEEKISPKKPEQALTIKKVYDQGWKISLQGKEQIIIKASADIYKEYKKVVKEKSKKNVSNKDETENKKLKDKQNEQKI